MLKVGDRISISFTEMIDKKSYSSRIEDICEDETYLVISIPTSISKDTKERYDVISVGSRFFITLTNPGYIVSYPVLFTNYEEDNFNRFARVRIVAEGNRIQRRESYRLERVLPFKFHIGEYEIPEEDEENVEEVAEISEEEKNKTEEDVVQQQRKVYVPEDTHEGKVINISGKGIKFTSDSVIPSDTDLYTFISLEKDGDVITPIGRILSISEQNKETNLITYRLKFTKISRFDKEKIAQWVWKEQIDALQ